jgi:RNA polymerase-binding transcription factor DksA
MSGPNRPIEREPLDEQTLKKVKYLSTKEMKEFKDMLLRLRDRIIDEISFLANDNLNRSQRESSGDLSSYSFHMADQGTDNFDREFAANLLSSEQDVLYEINEALRRIDSGTYGVCEISGKPIERERLRVLPFVRYCVAIQSELERGKPRFRPFRRTSIQTTES